MWNPEEQGFEKEQGYLYSHISDEASRYKETSAEVNIWSAKVPTRVSLAKITLSDSKQGSGSLFYARIKNFSSHICPWRLATERIETICH